MIPGMDLYMDKFEATLDLVGGNTGASGDKPRVEKRFEVNGPLSVALSLAAPVQFGLVLEVPRKLPPLPWPWSIERSEFICNSLFGSAEMGTKGWYP
jgi:hypothetical protein